MYAIWSNCIPLFGIWTAIRSVKWRIFGGHPHILSFSTKRAITRKKTLYKNKIFITAWDFNCGLQLSPVFLYDSLRLRGYIFLSTYLLYLRRPIVGSAVAHSFICFSISKKRQSFTSKESTLFKTHKQQFEIYNASFGKKLKTYRYNFFFATLKSLACLTQHQVKNWTFSLNHVLFYCSLY